MLEKRKSIPKEVQLRVWKKDKWTCQYCGEQVFFTPTLKLLEKMSPGHGYYHKNGKVGEVLELFRKRWASVDHVNPHARGGEHNEKNFVTACWDCNMRLNNKTLAEGKPMPGIDNELIQSVNWDGLSSLYIKLNKEEDIWTKLLKS